MVVIFEDFEGFEDTFQNNDKLKKAIQTKLDEFEWVDSDAVVVDYIVSQVINLKGDRQQLATEIEEIVIHTDTAVESARKINDLIDDIYTRVQQANPANAPKPIPTISDSDFARDYTHPDSLRNGQNGNHITDQVQSGRIEKPRNGQTIVDNTKVFDSMLNGNNNGRLAQAAQNISSTNETPQAKATSTSPQGPQPGVCIKNWLCSNSDCTLAHQSPVAPQGVIIDLSIECPADVACKNYKCRGWHRSPAMKFAYQSTLNCRYAQYCKNANCTFNHDNVTAKAPYCLNGADCPIPNCRFTHSTVMCRFNPCKNTSCTFKHNPGQKASSTGTGAGAGISPNGAGRQNVWIKPLSETLPSEGEELILPGTQITDADLPLQLAGSGDSSTCAATPVAATAAGSQEPTTTST